MSENLTPAQRALLKLGEQIRKDPFTLWKVLDVNPSWQQAEAIKVFRPGVKIVVHSGHSTGKTFFLGMSIYSWLIAYPHKPVPCTAPSAPQLRDVLWARLGDIHRMLKRVLPAIGNLFRLTTDRLYHVEYPDTWFAVARTAKEDQPEALQGFHDCLFVVDEASGVPDPIFRVARASLASGDSTLIMTGNPTRMEGYFIESFNNERFVRFRWNAEESPFADEGYIKELREECGPNYMEANEYRIRVLGLPPLAQEDKEYVVPRVWIESAANKTETDYPVNRDEPIIMGLDVAYRGSDQSAAVIRQGRVVLHAEKMKAHVSDLNLVADWAIMLHDTFKPDKIFIDIIGYGSGVHDIMKARGYPVVGINVHEGAVRWPDRFYRLRDELYHKMREWFREGCRIPNIRELKEEIGLMWFETKDRKKKVVSKTKVRGKFGSPDLADALALTFVTQSLKRNPRMLRRARQSYRPICRTTGY